MRKATKRSLQMCLTIVAGFVTCWLPYYALYVCLRFGLAPREVSLFIMHSLGNFETPEMLTYQLMGTAIP